MSQAVQHFGFFLEACYDIATKKFFLHDLITRVFMRSIQNGIVVLGFLDAFVHAHHKHSLNSENSGNFGHCMKGRIRFMTAITPAYALAYQATCLARHVRWPGISNRAFIMILYMLLVFVWAQSKLVHMCSWR